MCVAFYFGGELYTILFLFDPSSCIVKPPSGSHLDWCQSKVRSMLKLLLTFTLPGDGVFGIVFHLFGCLLSYISFFTISYQVNIQLYNCSY